MNKKLKKNADTLNSISLKGGDIKMTTHVY